MGGVIPNERGSASRAILVGLPFTICWGAGPGKSTKALSTQVLSTPDYLLRKVAYLNGFSV